MTAKNQKASETPPWGPSAVPPLPGGNPMDITHQPPEQAQNPFVPEIPDNPFLKPAEPEPEAPPEPHEPDENTPAWNKFVAFILEHGDVIQRAEYPSPKGPVVDTIWQGVPVLDGPAAKVRHKLAGWVDWETAIKGTKYA